MDSSNDLWPQPDFTKRIEWMLQHPETLEPICCEQCQEQIGFIYDFVMKNNYVFCRKCAEAARPLRPA